MKMLLKGLPCLLLAVVLCALCIAGPTAADASTAQGTVIQNRATVSYNDAGGAAQTPVTVTADVTVTLVQAAPNVTASVATATVNQGSTTTVTYTVTATSNGQETYNFASAAGVGVPVNMTAVGTGGAAAPASFALGASTLAANAPLGATSIKVPYNPTDPAGSVNGIAPGDTIVIGGNPYVVAVGGIDKTNATVWGDPNYNMVTVTLTSAIAVTAGTAGQVVGERTTFNVTYSSGTVGGGGNSGTFTVAGTVKSGTGPTGTSGDTTITVNKPALTVTKQVSTDGGVTFAATGNATPGTSLVYKITITNSGAGDATSVRITDALPPYLTYVAGQSKSATAAATAYAAASALTEGAGGFTYAANTVTYNPGSPGLGTVAPTGVLVLFYRCTIN